MSQELIEIQFHATITAVIENDETVTSVMDFLRNSLNLALNCNEDFDCEDFAIDETTHITRKDLFE